jgi:REP-associated tyrosine transposase
VRRDGALPLHYSSAMNDESQKQHRRSIRLKHYDYAKEGMYFFTICTYKRQFLFGTVANGEMHLNDFGQIVYDEWQKTPEIRHEIQLDLLIVMPNHLHGIVIISNRNVGATGGSPFPARINKVRGTPEAPVWQRNFYEHVIRDEESLNRIREYILNNPAQWDLDPENPEAKGDRPVAPTHHGVTFGNSR